MAWHKGLVASFSTRWLGFAHIAVHVGFVVDKVTLGFFRVIRFSPVNIS